MLTHGPETTMTARQHTAVRRATLPSNQARAWIRRTCDEVAASLYHRGIVAAGYPFARLRPRPGHRVEVEAGIPTTAAVGAEDGIEPSVLPGGPAVWIRYVGPADQVEQAYQAIGEWLQDERVRGAEEAWEIYRDLPIGDQRRARTEVIQPIAAAR
ncbi:GyrI-like small molecule binding protein [Kribbella amoyensis]|uniref:GyrI-like small molecule binding protein n=1 Tax=Kribbella amoyensis TaxID=996641 RepID=A0A561C0T3_9ACTN|nr:GyrI-like domain-containing protein [Kribbella amoyensis]TWD84657.1 GyrI-like small molecule binding protein [Kribbella amoyensis]